MSRPGRGLHGLPFLVRFKGCFRPVGVGPVWLPLGAFKPVKGGKERLVMFGGGSHL